MSDFVQEFATKVRDTGTSVGGGAGRGANGEKKSFDKRWIVLGGLVAVLIVVLVVLMAISQNGNGVSSSDRDKAGTAVSGIWVCEDDSTLVFDGKNVRWTDEVGMIEDEYIVESQNRVTFGNVGVDAKGDTIELTNSAGVTTVCRRES